MTDYTKGDPLPGLDGTKIPLPERVICDRCNRCIASHERPDNEAHVYLTAASGDFFMRNVRCTECGVIADADTADPDEAHILTGFEPVPCSVNPWRWDDPALVAEVDHGDGRDIV